MGEIRIIIGEIILKCLLFNMYVQNRYENRFIGDLRYQR